ncbi:MAG TPA: hypothetical protein VHC22_21945 [Pirellulales bacterium]|nr:hypothetical protein [Pirellulales bacterium]
MASKEQVAAVASRIAWLKSMTYFAEEGQLPSICSDLSLPEWGDLSHSEQRTVLATAVNWDGFTKDEQNAVINHALASPEEYDRLRDEVAKAPARESQELER